MYTIAFKIIQMKFLAMHVTNKTFNCDIFTAGNVQNIFMEHNDFWHKRKVDHFDPYSVLLAIATHTPVLLMTAFVLQAHIFSNVHMRFVITIILRGIIKPSGCNRKRPR